MNKQKVATIENIAIYIVNGAIVATSAFEIRALLSFVTALWLVKVSL